MNDTSILYERNEKELADATSFLPGSSKLMGLAKISFFFGFSEFLTVLSLFIAYFLIYILKSPKTSRPIRVKMFRLFNQQDNGAISKISKKLQQVTLQIYLMRTKSSQ